MAVAKYERNFGPALETHTVLCWTCKTRKLTVQVWPGDKPPRKICSHCQGLAGGSHHPDAHFTGWNNTRKGKP